MTSPEIANVLKKYVTSKPLRFGGPLSGNKQTRQNRKDFEELQALALKDMDAFNKKLNDMKAKQGDSHSAVRQVLAKAGLSKYITDNNKIEGDETMNESYKDKFNAQMKKFGIDSLDDLKTDADKKAFFKAVDKSHTAKNEEKINENIMLAPKGKGGEAAKKLYKASYKEDRGFSSSQIKQAYGVLNDPRYKQGNYSGAVSAIEKIAKGLSDHPDVKNAMKRANESLREEHDCENEHPGKSHDAWAKSKEKNEMKDLEPNAKEINAMVKDPHKSKEGNPKDDILAHWSDASVKADVKKKGGADMSKVKDAPKPEEALRKVTASYESKKYHDIKPGSIQDSVMQMQVNEQKSVIVKSKELSAMVETYLNKGGVSRNLSPAINELWPAVALGVAGAAALGTYAYKKIKKATSSMRKPAPTLPKENKLPLQTVREFIDTYNRHFLTNFKAEEFVVSDRLNENQIKEVTEDEIVSIKVPELSGMIETYLNKGGVIDTTSINEDVDLDEEINALPLHEVRDFINTYNKYFMTNHKVEEFILQVDEGIKMSGGTKPIKPNPLGSNPYNVKLSGGVPIKKQYKTGNPHESNNVSPGHGNSRRGDAPKKPGLWQKFVKGLKRQLGYINQPQTKPNPYKGGAFDIKINTGIAGSGQPLFPKK